MKRLAAAFAMAIAAIAMVAPAARASTVTIRQVDTTHWPTVRVVVLAAGDPKTTDFNVRDGGTLVENLDVVPLGKSATPVGTVLTIDESGSMASGGRIEAAKVAARQFVDRMLPSEQVAIIAFSSAPRIVTQFTNDHAALLRGIDALRAHGETALWDGVRAATGLLEARPDLQPNIIVLSDGHDTTSLNTPAQAKAGAVAVKAVVFGVGLGDQPDAGPLTGLANDTGGRYLAAPSSAVLSEVYGTVQSALQGQFELSYKASGTEARDVVVTIGTDHASASVVPGSLTRGANTRPVTVNPPRAPGFLAGWAGRLLLMGLAFLTVGLAAWAIVMTVTRPRSELARVLAPYSEDRSEDLDERVGGVSIVDSALMKKAVDIGSRFAIPKKIMTWLDERLELANVPMRAEEALFVFGAVEALAALLFLVTAGPITAVAVCGGLLLAGVSTLKFMARRRRSKFNNQLPDALKLLSGTLKAGYSLMQGVETLASEIGEPMGQELRRVLTEARLGRPLDEALEEMADRLKSADFEWTVMAIGIQREVGGNLSELLETVADTMTERERLRRDVKALTAEGKVSAIVIGILPIALGAVMWVINPEYIGVLFKDSLGQIIAAGSGLLAVFGFWWMKKTIEIDV